ncbi:MAG: hypothetical protein LAO30_22960 [Acidobacteriia bacterium]|nr:hypothetical protein [Terriglobia bacterium]
MEIGEIIIRPNATALVDNSGVPTIEYNSARGLDECTAIHESFHLKYLAEGFPEYRWAAPQLSSENELFLDRVRDRIRNGLEHALFFPEMIQMGCDPTAELRATTGSSISPRPNILGVGTTDFAYAASCFKVLAEQAGVDATQYSTLLIQKGWRRSVTVGQAMWTSIASTPPTTPEAQVLAVTDGLNTAFMGQQRFEFAGWGPTDQRGAHRQRTVVIRLQSQ